MDIFLAILIAILIAIDAALIAIVWRGLLINPPR